MERADEVLAAPIAHESGAIRLKFLLDPGTGAFIGADFDHNNLPKESWAYVASVLRPVIFLTNDMISIPILTSEIEREHLALRGALKPLRADLERWRKHLYVGHEVLGPAENPLPEGKTRVTAVWIGPANTTPEGVDVSGAVGDAYYANVFFNGCLWHSDDAKAAEYQQASPHLQAHIRKCAEIRTLSAIPFVATLSAWIIRQRSVGYDL
jgi:hypothetical protein